MSKMIKKIVFDSDNFVDQVKFVGKAFDNSDIFSQTNTTLPLSIPGKYPSVPGYWF